MSVHISDHMTNGVTSSFADELCSQFLLCPLCSQTYRQPKILSCQHSFCADCIEMHYEMDEADRPYRFLLSYTRDISCPVCRKRTSLPVGGVRRLPDNFLVANLADVIGRRKPMTSLLSTSSCQANCDICSAGLASRRRQSLGGVTMTSSMEGEDKMAAVAAASFKCLDCAKVLCRNCAELHRRTKVTAQHGLFSIGVEQDVECKIHKNEILRFYCEPCETCICVLCTFQDHSDHEVTSLLDGLERHRQGFESLLDDCRSRINVVRGQLQLIGSCETGLRLAEDHIRDAAIESIAAVRRREKQLLMDLRQAVGEKTFEFMADRKSLEDQLSGLDSALSLTEKMMHGTSVELLMLKKDIIEKLNSVLEIGVKPTPDGLRRTVQLLPEDCFSDVSKSELFSLGANDLDSFDGQRKDSIDVNIQTEVKDVRSVDTSTKDDGIFTSSIAGTQTHVDDFDRRPVLHPVVVAPPVNHVHLTAPRPEAVQLASADVDTPLPTAVQTAASGRRSSVQGRWPLEKSNSQTSADATPSPTSTGPRYIPNYSRPKPPSAVLVDAGTEMEPVFTVETASWTSKTVTCEKETSTGYIILVHKNVSTENQTMVDKATSTATNDVTAAYRNLTMGTSSRRSVTVSRGTGTSPKMTADRASSPVKWPISVTSTAVSKIPTSPMGSRPVLVTSSAAGMVSIRTGVDMSMTSSETVAQEKSTPVSITAVAAVGPQQQKQQPLQQQPPPPQQQQQRQQQRQQMTAQRQQQNVMTSRPTSLTSSATSWAKNTCHQT